MYKKEFVNIVLICIPFFFIQLNPTSYISWIIDSIVVGIYAVFVILISGILFERIVMLDTIKRVLRMVGR